MWMVPVLGWHTIVAGGERHVPGFRNKIFQNSFIFCLWEVKSIDRFEISGGFRMPPPRKEHMQMEERKSLITDNRGADAERTDRRACLYSTIVREAGRGVCVFARKCRGTGRGAARVVGTCVHFLAGESGESVVVQKKCAVRGAKCQNGKRPSRLSCLEI